MSNARNSRHRNDMQVLQPHAAGIDVSADFHAVAVPPDSDGHVEVRFFGSCTPDLHAMATWLRQHEVTTVAMESTGVYWIALYDLLEKENLEALLLQ